MTSDAHEDVRILAIDVGGQHVKILASGETEPRRMTSGPELTPSRMVAGVRDLAEGWAYDVIAMGYPGVVRDGAPAVEPANLGPGWVGFDYEAAFGCPVRVMNDAAMQALGSYRGGRMLFLGLGTGLGSAIVDDGQVLPLELAHLPYREGTFEDYVGEPARREHGGKKWRHRVEDVVARLARAMEPDEVVLGGGNARRLHHLPPGCRLGDNANAFTGGFRMWEDADVG
ncbi:MAG: ROK family protein [Myxococcales bacterium]|nr:ROK family protein [Myxococcales bacterium]